MQQRARRTTLSQLRARRSEILRIAAEYDANNVRVIGSVARGEADKLSDVDFLVDIDSNAVGFAYFGLLEDLRRALEDFLGLPVDVVDSAALRQMRDSVLNDAVVL